MVLPPAPEIAVDDGGWIHCAWQIHDARLGSDRIVRARERYPRVDSVTPAFYLAPVPGNACADEAEGRLEVIIRGNGLDRYAGLDFAGGSKVNFAPRPTANDPHPPDLVEEEGARALCPDTLAVVLHVSLPVEEGSYDIRFEDDDGGSYLASGVFLDEAASDLPVVVLGSVAAQRLGVADGSSGTIIWLGDEWFSVVGVMETLDLSPDLDRAALVSYPTSEAFLDHDGVPSTIYVRSDPDDIDAVRSVLPATVNPESPDEVEVTRPSDALEAKEAADQAFTNLLLGLGAVALLVGGVGIANVMVISVLERRGEIGLRRALGATRRHISIQFLGESLILATLGGLGGVALGSAVTALYAWSQGWGVLIPTVAVVGGMAAALIIGVVAGLYPAMRAARVSPTEALRTL